MSLKNNKFEKSKSFWEDEPLKFSSLYSTRKILLLPNKIFLQKRIKIIEKYLKVDLNCSALDVGCGSGEFTSILKKYFGKVFAIYISEKMIELAKKNDDAKEIEFHIGECNKLPFEENSMDFIFALGLFDYVDNINSVIGEFLKVLKKNGEMIITIPKSPSIFFPFRFFTGIRYKLFDAPPIVNSLSKKQLLSVLNENKLEVKQLKSLWTTTWILHAKRL